MEYEENFNLIGDMVEDAFGVNVTYDEPGDLTGKSCRMRKRRDFITCLMR